MRLFLIFALMAASLQAEVVDRVAIAIDYQAITQLQIDEELRVTALLNHKPVVRDTNSRREAADRLVQQFLIKREMEVSRYPQPDSAEIDKYLAGVKADLGESSQFVPLLKRYELDEATLKDHLTLQLTTLRFIEFRFRPGVSVNDSEKRTDEALNAWLVEARKRFSIVYLDKTLE